MAVKDQTEAATPSPEEASRDEASFAGLEVDATGAAVNGLPARYRFVCELARGGMGRVFVVEDTVLRREVAIKEVLGKASKSAVRRFEREALLTARLSHPGIVAVHEFARRASGEPYLIMRRVQGRPFGEVIDAAGPLPARLALLPAFINIADAVAYAHGQGVIHRDLKPNNVLFGEFGDTVVIDWGLAKELRAPSFDDGPPDETPAALASSPDLTRVGSVIGTPVYMSPEQARGEQVDARTDVYALGAMLYRLLGGRKPYANVPREKVVEAVRAGPPQALRELQPDLLPELATIVERAMARHPAGRYADAKELADDLKAFQTGRLVRSHAYSTRELLGRFARRNAATLAVGALSLVLLAGVAVASVRRIVKERDRANHEAQASRRVAGFLTKMFEVSSPTEARGRTITAREILDRGARDIDLLSQEPAVQAQLMSVIGDVDAKLGLYAQARPLLEKALSARRRLLGDGHPDTLQTLQQLATLEWREGRYTEAEALNREALEGQRRALGPENAETLATAASLGAVYESEGRLADAEKIEREVLEAARRVSGNDAPATLAVMTALANAILQAGRDAEAQKILREALAIERRVLGNDHLATIATLDQLGRIEVIAGHYPEAIALQEEALAARRRVLGENHPETLYWLGALGNSLSWSGKPEQGMKLMQTAVDGLRRTLGPEHRDTLHAIYWQAVSYGSQHRYAEAEKLDEQVLEARRRVLGADHPDTIDVLVAYAADVGNQGRLDESEKLQLEALELQRRAYGPDNPDTARSLLNLAYLAAKRGDVRHALAYLRESMDHGVTSGDLIDLPDEPDWKKLAGNPRYDALVKEIKARVGKR